MLVQMHESKSPYKGGVIVLLMIGINVAIKSVIATSHLHAIDIKKLADSVTISNLQIPQLTS